MISLLGCNVSELFGVFTDGTELSLVLWIVQAEHKVKYSIYTSVHKFYCREKTPSIPTGRRVITAGLVLEQTQHKNSHNEAVGGDKKAIIGHLMCSRFSSAADYVYESSNLLIF